MDAYGQKPQLRELSPSDDVIMLKQKNYQIIEKNKV